MKLHRCAPLAACAALAAGCGAAAATGPTIPDVRGKNLPDAVVAVYEAHLCVHAVEGHHVPWGSSKSPIVAESPSPGRHVKAWSLVTVTVRTPALPFGGSAQVSHISHFDVVWGGPKPPCPPVWDK
jgi:hypothetical protein